MRLTSLLLACVLFLPSCYTITHTVGSGANGSYNVMTQRQWFILWGLIPLNYVDAGKVAAEHRHTNYTITTQQSFLDVVINIITGLATIHSRTVTVTI